MDTLAQQTVRSHARTHRSIPKSGLMMWSSVWLREHNRVAGILHSHHPSWNDEQLFQTTRNVVNGIFNKILVEEYLRHVIRSQFSIVYKPTLLKGTEFQFQGRVTAEFNIGYR